MKSIEFILYTPPPAELPPRLRRYIMNENYRYMHERENTKKLRIEVYKLKLKLKSKLNNQ